MHDVDHDHPLRRLLESAALDQFPDADGAVDWMPPDGSGTCAVVEFTGHTALLTDLAAPALQGYDLHGFGGCTHPEVLLRLAHGTSTVARTIGSLDAVLVARARPGRSLPARCDLDDHPRVRRARQHRRDVEVFGDERGLVTLGRGVVGRLELSIERSSTRPGGHGDGRALVEAGLAAAPDGALVWAQVAPGNAASLRAFLSGGFRPIAAEVLFTAPADER
jgi:hypothetical protein